ncbi:MAG: DUF1700 domain-containing protein [Oscillospiraceae bacterium]
MTKMEFIENLKKHIELLPQNEQQRSIAYYDEIIDDRIEDGTPEDEVIESLGDMREIVNSIMYDMSIPALVRARVSESREKTPNRGVWITLAIVGSPIWFPLGLAFALLILALYATVWSLIIALYAIVLSFAIAGVVGFVGGIVSLFLKRFPLSLCAVGAALVMSALAMFMFKPVIMITKSLIRLTALIIKKIKSLFISKKEVA